MSRTRIGTKGERAGAGRGTVSTAEPARRRSQTGPGQQGEPEDSGAPKGSLREPSTRASDAGRGTKRDPIDGKPEGNGGGKVAGSGRSAADKAHSPPASPEGGGGRGRRLGGRKRSASSMLPDAATPGRGGRPRRRAAATPAQQPLERHELSDLQCDIWWESKQTSYWGTLGAYNATTNTYQVDYDDGDVDPALRPLEYEVIYDQAGPSYVAIQKSVSLKRLVTTSTPVPSASPSPAPDTVKRRGTRNGRSSTGTEGAQGVVRSRTPARRSSRGAGGSRSRGSSHFPSGTPDAAPRGPRLPSDTAEPSGPPAEPLGDADEYTPIARLAARASGVGHGRVSPAPKKEPQAAEDEGSRGGQKDAPLPAPSLQGRGSKRLRPAPSEDGPCEGAQTGPDPKTEQAQVRTTRSRAGAASAAGGSGGEQVRKNAALREGLPSSLEDSSGDKKQQVSQQVPTYGDAVVAQLGELKGGKKQKIPGARGRPASSLGDSGGEQKQNIPPRGGGTAGSRDDSSGGEKKQEVAGYGQALAGGLAEGSRRGKRKQMSPPAERRGEKDSRAAGGALERPGAAQGRGEAGEGVDKTRSSRAAGRREEGGEGTDSSSGMTIPVMSEDATPASQSTDPSGIPGGTHRDQAGPLRRPVVAKVPVERAFAEPAEEPVEVPEEPVEVPIEVPLDPQLRLAKETNLREVLSLHDGKVTGGGTSQGMSEMQHIHVQAGGPPRGTATGPSDMGGSREDAPGLESADFAAQQGDLSATRRRAAAVKPQQQLTEHGEGQGGNVIKGATSAEVDAPKVSADLHQHGGSKANLGKSPGDPKLPRVPSKGQQVSLTSLKGAGSRPLPVSREQKGTLMSAAAVETDPVEPARGSISEGPSCAAERPQGPDQGGTSKDSAGPAAVLGAGPPASKGKAGRSGRGPEQSRVPTGTGLQQGRGLPSPANLPPAASQPHFKSRASPGVTDLSEGLFTSLRGSLQASRAGPPTSTRIGRVNLTLRPPHTPTLVQASSPSGPPVKTPGMRQLSGSGPKVSPAQPARSPDPGTWSPAGEPGNQGITSMPEPPSRSAPASTAPQGSRLVPSNPLSASPAGLSVGGGGGKVAAKDDSLKGDSGDLARASPKSPGTLPWGPPEGAETLTAILSEERLTLPLPQGDINTDRGSAPDPPGALPSEGPMEPRVARSRDHHFVPLASGVGLVKYAGSPPQQQPCGLSREEAAEAVASLRQRYAAWPGPVLCPPTPTRCSSLAEQADEDDAMELQVEGQREPTPGPAVASAIGPPSLPGVPSGEAVPPEDNPATGCNQQSDDGGTAADGSQPPGSEVHASAPPSGAQGGFKAEGSDPPVEITSSEEAVGRLNRINPSSVLGEVTDCADREPARPADPDRNDGPDRGDGGNDVQRVVETHAVEQDVSGQEARGEGVDPRDVTQPSRGGSGPVGYVRREVLGPEEEAPKEETPKDQGTSDGVVGKRVLSSEPKDRLVYSVGNEDDTSGDEQADKHGSADSRRGYLERDADQRDSADNRGGTQADYGQDQEHDVHQEKDADMDRDLLYRSRGYVKRTTTESHSHDIYSDDKEDWESQRAAEGRRYRSHERDRPWGDRDRDRDWKRERDHDRGYNDGRSSRQYSGDRGDRDRDRYSERNQGHYDSRARSGRDTAGRRRYPDARYEGDTRKDIHRLSRQSDWSSEPRYGRDSEPLSRKELEAREDRAGLEWSGDHRRGLHGRGSAGSYSGNSQPPSPLRGSGSGRPPFSSNGSAGASQAFTFRQGRIFNCGKEMEAALLDRLLMGSDILEYVEGCGERTAVFLWNYETQRMHGVFSGTAPAGPIAHPTWASCPYKYAVRVKPHKPYPPLDLNEIRRVLGSPKGRTGWYPNLDEQLTRQLIDAFTRKEPARK
eukprot:jgi/Botrbrau1/7290/Bobra.0318s0024.2